MFGRRFFGRLRRINPARAAAGALVAQAQQAHAAGHYPEAAALYQEALRLVPGHAAWHVQCGHMLKEAGWPAEAERHYREADRLKPGDADLALQFGHLHKVAGRPRAAEAAYRRAIALAPDWAEPARQLAILHAEGWPLDEDAADTGGTADPLRAASDAALHRARLVDRLAPELAPHAPDALLRDYREHIDVKRLGQTGPALRGALPTLRGVEAVRGFCISSTPIVTLEIAIGGRIVHRGPLRGPYELPLAREQGRYRKYVFNAWLDLSAHPKGRFAVTLVCRDAEGRALSYRQVVMIAAPWAEADYPDSDALVSIPPNDGRSVEERVNARPSVVRGAARQLFPRPPAAILVQRTDQLGDMVASIPALTRLRAMFPAARIVGLVTGANADFAATLGLFDAIEVIEFPDDEVERRRLMPVAAQEELRARLAPYRFDMAIDLSQAGVSRPLLRLSGAPFVLGVGDGAWPWLGAGFDFNTHDPLTRLDMIPHSAKVLAMIEALGAVLTSQAPVIRRPDLSRERLAAQGLAPDDRYVLLHLGARIVFSRWPHYAALARLILDRTGLKVVMMTEDAGVRATLPAALTQSDRFVLLDRRLAFDDFDALVSFAAVLVGNDSGPKHLASLRGVDAVTLFTNRIDWREWGQETGGAIIARKVPCAGCLIFHDAEECGKDFACIALIAPEEVFEAVMRYV